MENQLKILILEDLPSDAELAKREVNKTLANSQFRIVDNEVDYVSALNTFKPDLIISDYQLPTFNGLAALKIKKNKVPFVPFIILTGSMNEDTAVECMKAGADDYIIKEHIKRIGMAATSAIANKKIELEQRLAEINLKKTLKYLSESRQQFRELNKHVQNIRENERIEISREIHDTLGQALTALKMDLIWIQKKTNIIDEEILLKFDEMKELINETTSSVQRISMELRPGLLDDLGLTYALEWQCREFEKRTDIKTVLKITPNDIILNEHISVALFRITQESLTNIVRHAKATEVNIYLIKNSNSVELMISDNGVGINEEKTKDPKSLGLLGITERVFSINGEVKFVKGEKSGTEVIVVAPLKNEDKNK